MATRGIWPLRSLRKGSHCCKTIWVNNCENFSFMGAVAFGQSMPENWRVKKLALSLLFGCHLDVDYVMKKTESQ